MTIRTAYIAIGWLLFAASCATSKEAHVDSTRVAAATLAPSPPPAPEIFNAKQFAAQNPHPVQCEAGARALQQSSRDNAWQALKACVQRGNFTDIRVLVRAWAQDLQSRKEAPQLLAKLIADRGGNVPPDLKLLHEHRIPLFSLSAAMTDPENFKGRYVVLRAMVSEIRNDGSKPTVELAEYSLGTAQTEVDVGPRYKSTSSYNRSSSGSVQGSASARVNTTNYGNASAKGSYKTSGSNASSGSSSNSSGTTESRYDNVSNETGRVALGRLSKPDPFLAPEKELVMLARFEGVSVSSEAPEETGEPETVAVLTIVKYFDPNPLVVF